MLTKKLAVLALLSVGFGWLWQMHQVKKTKVIPLSHGHTISRKKLISHVKFRTPHPIDTCCGYPEFDIEQAEAFNVSYHYAEKFCHKGVAIEYKTQRPICIQNR